MTVFLIIGAVGLAIALVALLLGDVVDGVLHLDAFDSDLFSTAALAAFIGAFGFGGAIALAVVDWMWLAVLIGLVVGVVAGWGALSLTRFLKSDASGKAFRADSLVGAPGRVITAIPEGGLCEVQVRSEGHLRKLAARADQAIPGGSDIWVTAILSPTSVHVTRTRDADDIPSIAPPTD